ncbi:MAG: hypothetical protein ACRCWN_04325 [Fusobacteriaceae bacterium]
MMKNIVMVLLFFLNSLTFADVRDGEGLFSPEETKEIEKEIEKIENSKKVRIILNTLPYGEGFVVDNPVRTIIINIGKSEEGNLKIENSFSRDLTMEENEDELNAISDSLVQYVEKDEMEKYSIEYLRGIDKILSEESKEKKVSFGELLYQNRWFLIKMLVLILTIFNILVRIKHVSIEKQKRYEKKLEKEKIRREEMKVLMEKRKHKEN